jgi:hypothetical protein
MTVPTSRSTTGLQPLHNNKDEEDSCYTDGRRARKRTLPGGGDGSEARWGGCVPTVGSLAGCVTLPQEQISLAREKMI